MKYLRCILIYILVFFHSLSLYPLAPPSPDMAGMVEQARAKLAGPTNRLAADFYQTPKVVSPLPFPNNILNERNDKGWLTKREPDWMEFSLIAKVLLECLGEKGEGLALGCLRERAAEKYQAYRIGFSNKRFLQLLNSMRRRKIILSEQEYDFLLEDSAKVILNVNPQVLAVWADSAAVFYVQEDLRQRVKDKGRLAAIINRYSEVADQWAMYGLEVMDPILKALAQMEDEERAKIVGAIKDLYCKQARSRLVDTILLQFDFESVKDGWLQNQAADLIDRRIYMAAAEITLLAGGLGRVMRYHGNALNELGANVNYIEPMYRRDKKGNKIDYSKKVQFIKKNFYTFRIKVQGQVVEVKVHHAKTKEGIPVFLVEDSLPEGLPEEQLQKSFVYKLYTYRDRGNQDKPEFKNLVTNMEFTEFFSKASLELLRRLENENRKREGREWKPPVIDANDGQVLPLTAFAEIFYRQGGRDVLDGQLSKREQAMFKQMTFCGTTHTYRNRVDEYDVHAGKDFLSRAGIPPEWQWIFYRKEKGKDAQDLYDFTSAGLRCADAAKGVSAVHTHEVGVFDPDVDLVGVRNGDSIEYSSSVFQEIMRGLYGDDKDYYSLTPEEIGQIKSKAKERLGLDAEKMVVSYSGRLVPEKAGMDVAFTRKAIFDLVKAGVQVVIYGNVQSSKVSAKLAEDLRKIGRDLEKKNWPGRFVFKDHFSIEEQLELLAATDIQVQYSTRETGACEYTEADVSACGGLQCSPPFWEGLIGKQGIPIDWKNFTGNTLVIPEEKAGRTYPFLNLIRHANQVFSEEQGNFLKLQRNSLRLSRILHARATAAEYLRFWNWQVQRREAADGKKKSLAPQADSEIERIRLDRVTVYQQAPVAQEVIDQGFRIMGTDPLNVVVKIDLRPEMGDWVNDAQSVRERVRVRLRDQHGSIKYLDYQYKRDNMAVFTTQMEGRSFNGWLEVSSGKWWEQTEFRVTAELSNDVTKAIENRIKTGQNFQIEAAVPALGSIQGEDEIEVEKGNSVKLLVKIPFTPEEGLTESDMSLVLYTDLFSADERWDIVEPSQLTGFKRVDTEDGSIAWEVEFIPQRNGRLTFYVTMRNAPQKQIWHSDHEGDDIVIQLVEPEAGSANEQSV